MTDSEQQNKASYIEAIQRGKLLKVALIGINFDVLPQMLTGQRLTPSFGRNVISYNRSEDMTTTIFEWEIKVSGSEEESESPIEEEVLCSTRWLVGFGNLSGVGAEAACRYSQEVGTTTSYPYFRGLVAQLAWNATLVLPPMPVITIGSFPPVPLEELTARQLSD